MTAAKMVSTLEGILSDSAGKLFLILGCSEKQGQAKFLIRTSWGRHWATTADLYRRGYHLVAAKPAIWDIWGYYGPTLRQQSPSGQGVLQ